MTALLTAIASVAACAAMTSWLQVRRDAREIRRILADHAEREWVSLYKRSHRRGTGGVS